MITNETLSLFEVLGLLKQFVPPENVQLRHRSCETSNWWLVTVTQKMITGHIGQAYGY